MQTTTREPDQLTHDQIANTLLSATAQNIDLLDPIAYARNGIGGEIHRERRDLATGRSSVGNSDPPSLLTIALSGSRSAEPVSAVRVVNRT